MSRQVAARCQWVLRVDIEQRQKAGLTQGTGYLEDADPGSRGKAREDREGALGETALLGRVRKSGPAQA